MTIPSFPKMTHPHILHLLTKLTENEVERLLPQNLSDEWLRHLLHDCDTFRGIEDNSSPDHSNFDCLVVAVQKIRATQSTATEDDCSNPYILTQSIHAYSLNLIFEAIARKEGASFELLTLENVLDMQRLRELRG